MRMKKSVFVTLSLAITLIFSSSVFAVPRSDSNSKEVLAAEAKAAKLSLAAKHANKFDPKLTNEERDKRSKDIEREIAKMVAGRQSKVNISKSLEKMNVFVLDTPELEPALVPMSAGSDITMSNVIISYDSVSARWNVTGGGYWANTNWVNDLPSFFGSWVGTIKNVGEPDTVGVTYYNVSGTVPPVVSSLGYFTDHNGWVVESTSPSHGNGGLGVAFDFQDKAKLVAANPGVYVYHGDGFAASVTYGSSFSSYSGYARSFYGHTWNSTGISSVTFGGSGSTYGVSINFSSTSNRFPAYSGADTVF